jgi:hypothetical protein
MASDRTAWEEFERSAGGRSADGLRRIIRYQKWLIFVVLAQLALWAFVLLFAIVRDNWPDMGFPKAVTFLLGCTGGIFVFLLSWELRGTFGAIAFGLATVIPYGALALGFAAAISFLGVFILTLVNGYASAELREHGMTVGVFGASLAAVQERPGLYDVDEDAGW